MPDIPLEAINVILGAVIAIATSSIGAVLSHILQMRKDKEARDREIEDRRSKRKQELFNKRAKLAEDFLDQLYNALQNHIDNMLSFLESRDRIEQLNNTEKILSTIQMHQGYITDLNDQYLSDKLLELQKIHMNLIIKSKNLHNIARADSTIKSVNDIEIMEYGTQILEIRTHMIERLDELSAKYY